MVAELSRSPFASGCCWLVPFLSTTGLLSTGGPIEGAADEDMSIGSRGGVRVEEPVEEGSMGIDLCSPWLCGSREKGLRRASATDAMAAIAMVMI